MNIILWILVGSVVGWLFGKIVRRKNAEARGAYVLLGILGSVGIALIAGQVGEEEPAITWFDLEPIGLALLGAIIAIGLGYTFFRSSGKNKSENDSKQS